MDTITTIDSDELFSSFQDVKKDDQLKNTEEALRISQAEKETKKENPSSGVKEEEKTSKKTEDVEKKSGIY